MRKVRFTMPILVVLAMLTVGLLPASAGQPGTGTSYIYVQNADSSEAATIVATFYGTSGSEDGTVNIASLPPYVGTTVDTDDPTPSLPSTWQGSVVVSSDRQIAAVGRTVFENVPTAPDGLTAGDYTALAAPQDTSFLAYVFDHPSRNNIIAVQNTGSSEATVTIHYLRRADGTEIPGGATCEGSPIVDTIPANGVVYYDLLNLTRNGVPSGGIGGKIPCMNADGTTQPPAGTGGGFEGAVYIESDTDIATATSIHWAKFEGSYTGATSDDDFLYYPQVVRHKNPSTHEWVRWSAVIVQNTGASPVDITVNFIGSPGLGSVTFDDTIPAYSSKGYNTRFRGDFSDTLWANCESGHVENPDCYLQQQFGVEDWTGAVTIKVKDTTPDGRIVGVGHVQYYKGRVFSYEALMPGDASTIAVCPRMQDQDAGTNRRWSAALVQNASTTTANIKLYLFDEDKTTGGLANADLTLDNAGVGYPVASGARFGFNTRFDADVPASAFDPLGNDWTGTAVVTSDQPILVTMSVFRADATTGEDWATDYNCYNVPTQ